MSWNGHVMERPHGDGHFLFSDHRESPSSDDHSPRDHRALHAIGGIAAQTCSHSHRRRGSGKDGALNEKQDIKVEIRNAAGSQTCHASTCDPKYPASVDMRGPFQSGQTSSCWRARWTHPLVAAACYQSIRPVHMMLTGRSPTSRPTRISYFSTVSGLQQRSLERTSS